MRYPSKGPTKAAPSTAHDEGAEHHEELDELFESLFDFSRSVRDADNLATSSLTSQAPTRIA